MQLTLTPFVFHGSRDCREASATENRTLQRPAMKTLEPSHLQALGTFGHLQKQQRPYCEICGNNAEKSVFNPSVRRQRDTSKLRPCHHEGGKRRAIGGGRGEAHCPRRLSPEGTGTLW